MLLLCFDVVVIVAGGQGRRVAEGLRLLPDLLLCYWRWGQTWILVENMKIASYQICTFLFWTAVFCMWCIGVNVVDNDDDCDFARCISWAGFNQDIRCEALGWVGCTNPAFISQRCCNHISNLIQFHLIFHLPMRSWCFVHKTTRPPARLPQTLNHYAILAHIFL